MVTVEAEPNPLWCIVLRIVPLNEPHGCPSLLLTAPSWFPGPRPLTLPVLEMSVLLGAGLAFPPPPSLLSGGVIQRSTLTFHTTADAKPKVYEK